MTDLGLSDDVAVARRLTSTSRFIEAPRSALADKTRRRLHRPSPSGIERCIFAHEAADDEPTPAFCRGVERGAGSVCATERRLLRRRGHCATGLPSASPKTRVSTGLRIFANPSYAAG